ncbi:MAG: hypothetical protein GXY42_01675 [Desulfovibrionales bacterium]|nr:hypothetical protein [Desulfovibrionales bacterium]
MRALATLALMLLVAGCTAGPDYVRPVLDVPQAFVRKDVAPAVTYGGGGGRLA